MMDVQRQEMEKYKAWVQRKPSQEKRRREQSPQNSPMKMVRVTVKQKHQMNMHRLITSPFRVSSLAPSEKGTQVESSCPKWRRKPTMGLVPRPEDGHMVSMVVRQVPGTGL